MLSIDLKKYLEEVDAMEKLVEPFVETASIERLKRVQIDLRTGLDSGNSVLPWKTERPIFIKPSTVFDSLSKRQPPIHIKFMFKAEFQRMGSGRRVKWGISFMNSKVSLCSADIEKIVFHIDLKNPGQLGPVFHFQINEDFAGSLAIPRVPFGFVLPTDCLDFAMAELYPEQWTQAQVSAHSITKIVDGQSYRAAALAADVMSFWKSRRKISPASLLQNYSFEEDLHFG
jgi:hypothetical protein